jgi:electron transport complex protein RnfG
MSKIRYFLKESWLLMISSVVFGGLLALTNAAWKPRIEQNEINKFSNLARLLVPQADHFEVMAEPIQVPLPKGGPATADVRKGVDASGDCVGWAFVCEGSGFSDKIKLVVGADANFETLSGFQVLACSETPGFGDKITIKNGFYQAQFKGVPTGKFTLRKAGDSKIIDSEIIAITGATVTSQAVVDILNTYVVPIREQLAQKGLLP